MQSNVITWSWGNWITIGLMGLSVLAVAGFLTNWTAKNGWLPGSMGN